MRLSLESWIIVGLLGAAVWLCGPAAGEEAFAVNGWQGRRRVSYQHQADMFYNYYQGQSRFGGAAAEMYPAPLPVPAFVGHTYVGYQPFMPHEFLYKHHRSYHTYNPGAGWTRTNVRYHTAGGYLQFLNHSLNFPKKSLSVHSLTDSMPSWHRFGRYSY